MNKEAWLAASEIFDSWRIIPRVVLFSYGGWGIHVTDKILIWYLTMPAVDRTIAATTLAGAILSTIAGLFPWIYRIYSDSARDWTTQKSSVSEVIEQPPSCADH